MGFQCTESHLFIEEAKIIDIAIPGDARVNDKELEKIEKCQFLREDIGKLWKLKKATVLPIVIGALIAVSDLFEKYPGKLNVTIRFAVIQRADLLQRAGLLRKVLAI